MVKVDASIIASGFLLVQPNPSGLIGLARIWRFLWISQESRIFARANLARIR